MVLFNFLVSTLSIDRIFKKTGKGFINNIFIVQLEILFSSDPTSTNSDLSITDGQDNPTTNAPSRDDELMPQGIQFIQLADEGKLDALLMEFRNRISREIQYNYLIHMN
jgi:hypothetical protein